MAFNVGDRVRMTAEFKAKMRGDCLPGKHVAPLPGEPPLEADLPDEGCMHCSTTHIEEFGECVGVVGGLMQWPDSGLGPEYEVFWEPDDLRYLYHPDDFELVEPKEEQ